MLTVSGSRSSCSFTPLHSFHVLPLQPCPRAKGRSKPSIQFDIQNGSHNVLDYIAFRICWGPCWAPKMCRDHQLRAAPPEDSAAPRSSPKGLQNGIKWKIANTAVYLMIDSLVYKEQHGFDHFFFFNPLLLCLFQEATCW